MTYGDAEWESIKARLRKDTGLPLDTVEEWEKIAVGTYALVYRTQRRNVCLVWALLFMAAFSIAGTVGECIGRQQAATQMEEP
jgi:hypothetical protein